MVSYEQIFVKTVAEYHDAVAKHGDKRKIAIFAGSLDENGESWCIDCRKSEPVIESCLEKAAFDNGIVIYCEVGSQEEWKSADNSFRKDDKLRLKTVPTLLDIESGKRLEEAQCADANLVKLLFEAHA